MRKTLKQPRPYLLKYAINGGQVTYTFFTRDEALVAYWKAKRCKDGEGRASGFTGWIPIGNPHLYKLAMPTKLEEAFHKL